MMSVARGARPRASRAVLFLSPAVPSCLRQTCSAKDAYSILRNSQRQDTTYPAGRGRLWPILPLTVSVSPQITVSLYNHAIVEINC